MSPRPALLPRPPPGASRVEPLRSIPQTLVVVADPADWAPSLPGVELVSARAYLGEPCFSQLRGVKVYNLCRSYRYQSVGYYVSLLAEARGHRPQPSVLTIQDMKLPALARRMSVALDELIDSALRPIRSDHFVLSIYFGNNLARRYGRLAQELFHLFPAPLLSAHFSRERGRWHLARIAPLPAADIPASHQPFVAQAAATYFAAPARRRARRAPARYAMAILAGPQPGHNPSNAKALGHFVRAAARTGIDARLISRADSHNIGRYDALFVRETTAVNHHTYRLCRRAAAEGLVVIDDPDAIVKCTNKVFLAQLLARHRIPTPATMIVHRDNVGQIVPRLGLPCILKRPDSSFSQGVVKAHSASELAEHLEVLLEGSELVIAQAFMPTLFDWRIGLIDGRPLWACRYHMAKNHWQIIKREAGGQTNYGKVGCVPIAQVPAAVVGVAVRAAALIGDGLFGVDVKQEGGSGCVIEVNDNPSIDAGFEDQVLKDQLYLSIMASFWRRLEARSHRAKEGS